MELRLAFVLALTLGACRPEIGDPCETSTDCSPVGDRLCDVTQDPGGYCTVFNCEPGECPEEAVCVKFGDERSPVEGCDDPLGAGPYARTFCLKMCKKNNDCRSGYECLNPETSWNAEVVDPFSRICGVPPMEHSRPKLNDPNDPDYDKDAPRRSNDVCSGDVTPEGGAGGAPADGGMGGAGN